MLLNTGAVAEEPSSEFSYLKKRMPPVIDSLSVMSKVSSPNTA